jgi:hypothetical protein
MADKTILVDRAVSGNLFRTPRIGIDRGIPVQLSKTFLNAAFALVVLGQATALGQVAPVAPVKGVIRGTVVDEKGGRVSNSTVYVSSTKGNQTLSGRLPPSARSDQQGHFVIRELILDEYEVTAYNDEQAYPDLMGTWLSFYKPAPKPRVRLTAAQPEAAVELRLGPKVGILMGTIDDATTGQGLDACAGFSSSHTQAVNTAYPVKATYRLLVPADADIAVEFWRDGYQRWHYTSVGQASSTATRLRLRPGEEKILKVHLHQSRESHVSKCGVTTLR